MEMPRRELFLDGDAGAEGETRSCSPFVGNGVSQRGQKTSVEFSPSWDLATRIHLGHKVALWEVNA